MKLALTLVCLLFLGSPFQASAAKLDWYVVKVKDGDRIEIKGASQDFADAYSFYIPVRTGKIYQNQTFIVTIDEIRGLATLLADANRNKGKGNRVDRITGLLVANLSSTLTNNLAITSEGSPLAPNPPVIQGSDDNKPPSQDTPPSLDQEPIVRVLETPIPAAMWLFGTALLGLVGIKLQVRGK